MKKAIVPLIFGSDSTQVTTISGDKGACPLYLPIGNMPLSIRNSCNFLAMVPITLLAVFPKKKDNKTQKRYYQGMQVLLERILERFKSASVQGIEVECADRRSRICHPIAYAWLANHHKRMLFLGLTLNGCSYCEVPPNWLGKYDEEYPIQDHARYRTIIQDCGLGCPVVDERE